VAVPAGERAAFEVVQAEAGLELAVVVFDPPANLRQTDEFGQRGVIVHVGQPVVGGLVGVGGPFDEQPPGWQGPSGLRGMSRLAGRTLKARNWDVIAAVGFSLVLRVP
jgi:hypothetical protein